MRMAVLAPDLERQKSPRPIPIAGIGRGPFVRHRVGLEGDVPCTLLVLVGAEVRDLGSILHRVHKLNGLVNRLKRRAKADGDDGRGFRVLAQCSS